MRLTGQAKEAFEKWLCSEEICCVVFDDGEYCILLYDLHPSAQWGIYQDWADSSGWIVNIYCNASGYLWEIHKNAENGGTVMFDSDYSGPNSAGCWDTIQEARNAAIEKLNELMNENTLYQNSRIKTTKQRGQTHD